MEGPGAEPVNRAIRAEGRRWQLGTPPSLQQHCSLQPGRLTEHASSHCFICSCYLLTDRTHRRASLTLSRKWMGCIKSRAASRLDFDKDQKASLACIFQGPLWHHLPESPYSFKATTTVFQVHAEMTSIFLAVLMWSWSFLGMVVVGPECEKYQGFLYFETYMAY